MVLLASDYDKSKYFKAADLEREKKFRIKNVTEEEFERRRARRKRSSSFGSPTMSAAWCSTRPTTAPSAVLSATTLPAGPARSSLMFPTMADFRGKMSPALRVRIPPPKQAAAAAAPPQQPAP